MNRLIEHIVDNDKLYFYGLILLLIAFGSQLYNPGFDGSFETLGIRENRYIKDQKAIDSLFKEDEKIFVEVVPGDGNLYDLWLDMQLFEDQLKQQFDPISVRSFIKSSKLFYSESKMKQVSMEESLVSFSKINLFKDLVSKDKKSFLVVLGLQKGVPEEVVGKINKVIQDHSFPSMSSFNITSKYHIEDGINKVLFHDLRLIISSILLAFLLIMYLAYKSGFAIFYISIIVMFSLLVCFLVFIQFDIAFNMITLLILPVVIVLSVADGIHLLTGMSKEDGNLPVSDRVKKVYGKYFVPSLLTSLTTAITFFSLGFNHTKSVVYLGEITGISILISFVVCFLMSPFLLSFHKGDIQVNNRFFSISDFFLSRKKMFTYLLLPIVIIAIFLVPKVQFKNDFEIFLPMNSELERQHDHIKDSYYSQAALELAFTLKDFYTIDSLKKINVLKDISSRLSEVEGVNVVRSAQTSEVVLSKFMVPIDLSKLSGYSRMFHSVDGSMQRIQVRVSDPNIIPEIEHEIRKIVEVYASDVKLTSPALVFNYVNREVGVSLVKSLLVSIIFLVLVFFLLTGSIIQSVIGMFANIVPLSVIVILFVLLDLNINIVTGMTAVVCLGLIVDDTIHAFYRKVVRKENLEELGFGMLTTTIVLVVGFGLFALSSIKPIIIFGLTSSLVFIVTLISDFTLLLYLLDRYDNYKNNTKPSR